MRDLFITEHVDEKAAIAYALRHDRNVNVHYHSPRDACLGKRHLELEGTPA